MLKKALKRLFWSLAVVGLILTGFFLLFFRWPEWWSAHRYDAGFITFYMDEEPQVPELDVLTQAIRLRLETCAICTGEAEHVVIFAEQGSVMHRIHSRIYGALTFNLGLYPTNRIITYREPAFGRDLLQGPSDVRLTHTVAHELAHSYQQKLLGERVRELPLWIVEGHADFAASGGRWSDPSILRTEINNLAGELAFLRQGAGFRSMEYRDMRRSTVRDGQSSWPTVYRWSALVWSYLVNVRGQSEEAVFETSRSDAELTREILNWAFVSEDSN